MVEVQSLDVSVILPTYNEATSIPWLIPEILTALRAAELEAEIIVVDDDSPDGTAEVAERLGETLPVRVIRRRGERGLATAALAGLRASRATACVVMDADGSHPVPAMVEMTQMVLADKAEIVVGSRRVPGGGSRDWPLFSQLKSRAAASLALGVTSMTDPTTGLMAVRRSLLEALPLNPVGWKIVLETVVKAHPSRLAEYPIVFTDRTAGENKQNFNVLRQYLSHLYRLYNFRFPAVIELLKFCLVGFLGVFVDLATVTTVKEVWGLDIQLCQVFGFSTAVVSNYALNRRFSFRRARRVPLVASFAMYLGANLVGLTLRMLTIHTLMALTFLDGERGYVLLSAIGIAVATFTNFLGAKFFAFAPRAPRRAKPTESIFPPALSQSERATQTLSWTAVGLGTLLVAFTNLVPHPERSVDERAHIQMASNIAEDLASFVHLSRATESQVHAPQTALTEPPSLFPLLLSGASRLGPVAVDLFPSLIFLTFLGACLAFLRPLGLRAASASALLTASSPWVVAQFALLEYEPLVAAFSAVGFAFLVRSEGKRRRLFALLSGLFIGLGFATQLWIILPGLSACLVYLVARTYEGGSLERKRWARASAGFFVGLAVGAISHLALGAMLSDEGLLELVERVYLSPLSGPRMAGTSPPAHPGATSASTWSYLIWLLRDHGALLVPLALGLPALTRRMHVGKRGLSAATLAAVLSLVPLSIPLAQDPLYMAPVLPFVYALSGLCLVSPESLPRQYARVNLGAARLSLGIAILMGSVWIFLLARDPGHFQGPAMHIAHIAIWCVPSLRILRGKTVFPALMPCALTSFALTALLTTWGARGLPH